MKIINPDYVFKDSPDAQFIVEHRQEIPDEFLTENANKRNFSSNNRMGDYHQFASVPVVVIEKWKREGFDVFAGDVKGSEIVERLKRENLDAFLTTTKRI